MRKASMGRYSPSRPTVSASPPPANRQAVRNAQPSFSLSPCANSSRARSQIIQTSAAVKSTETMRSPNALRPKMRVEST